MSFIDFFSLVLQTLFWSLIVVEITDGLFSFFPTRRTDDF